MSFYNIERNPLVRGRTSYEDGRVDINTDVGNIINQGKILGLINENGGITGATGPQGPIGFQGVTGPTGPSGGGSGGDLLNQQILPAGTYNTSPIGQTPYCVLTYGPVTISNNETILLTFFTANFNGSVYRTTLSQTPFTTVNGSFINLATNDNTPLDYTIPKALLASGLNSCSTIDKPGNGTYYYSLFIGSSLPVNFSLRQPKFQVAIL